jgi:hypothetical protein
MLSSSITAPVPRPTQHPCPGEVCALGFGTLSFASGDVRGGAVKEISPRRLAALTWLDR